ncbi:MAG: S1C family serine protease [Candidatus Omnitrophica bacterium]|nr:S1C family serine protease [Candidatus Omnitrophota bacterium]
MNAYRRRGGYRYLIMIVTVIALAITSSPNTGRGQTSIISTLLEKSKAVVNIKSEFGGVFGDPPQAFIHKESGSVIVRRHLIPMLYAQTGAGVILDKQGLIITNAHLVRQASRITVALFDGTNCAAELITVSPEYDLAVIRIVPPYPLVSFELSDSDSVRLDDRVYSIGGSILLKNTISEGRIRGIGVKKIQENYGEHPVQLIRINFDMYQGDSGSPLVDPEGKLLGIMSAKSAVNAKEAYAIPSNIILKAIRETARKATENSPSP